jgi:probable phosphoglycerate mutase
VRQPVYLVRHGQSEWNLLRLTQGQTAHPRLTALGREQAGTAAELVAADLANGGHSAARIVSSDLARAVQTADILAQRLGGERSCDIRLREQDLGELEGRSYDETWSAATEFDWSDPTQPIAGGESQRDVYHRMGAALDDIRSAEEATVLVSHGDAIRAAVAYLRGMKPEDSDWVEVPNGAVARIDGGLRWLAQ